MMGKVIPLNPRAMEIEVANGVLRRELENARLSLATAEQIIERQAVEIKELRGDLREARAVTTLQESEIRRMERAGVRRRSWSSALQDVVRGVLDRSGR